MLRMNWGAMPMTNIRSETGTIVHFSFARRSGNALQLSANGPLKSACMARKKTKHAIAKMVHREVGNHPFEIGLSPGGEGGEDDRAHGQSKQPRSKDSDFVRKKREEQTNESIDPHFRKHPRQHH